MTASFFRITSLAVVGRAASDMSTGVICAILESGIRPAVVVLLPPDGDDARSGDSATAAQSPATNLHQSLAQAGVQVIFPETMNDDSTGRAIRGSLADAVLIADDSIEPGALCNVAPAGLLSVSNAPLPNYRGAEPLLWALYHDEPLWISAYLANGGAQTGPILGTRPVEVRAGDGMAEILDHARRTCASLAAGVIKAALNGGCPCRPQCEWEGRAFTRPPSADILAEIARRLAAREYSHYV